MTEPRWDPTGTLVVGMREDPVVLASVGGAGRRLAIAAGEVRLDPPHIVIVGQGVNPAPFGRGSHRLGLARWAYTIRCVAPQGSEGDVQAMAIAGAVATYLTGRGWSARVVDELRRATVRSEESSTSGVVEDPDTRDPMAIVTASVVAAAQAVG